MGMGITVKDGFRCVDCFRCSQCRSKIKNLVYRTRGDGIYCMDCDEDLWVADRLSVVSCIEEQRLENVSSY